MPNEQPSGSLSGLPPELQAHHDSFAHRLEEQLRAVQSRFPDLPGLQVNKAPQDPQEKLDQLESLVSQANQEIQDLKEQLVRKGIQERVDQLDPQGLKAILETLGKLTTKKSST